MKPDVTTILLDFFGTLVDYSPSRTEQGYPRTHALLRELGVRASYEEFLALWVRVSEEHDRRSDVDDLEYSMTDVARGFLRAAGVDGAASDDAAVRRVITSYLAEWSSAVRPVPGVKAMLAGLAEEYRLAVVTNTHDPGMVPSLLSRMGVRALFEAVVTSVEVGYRKPHPAIYGAACRALGVTAAECVFVGDTFGADYDGPRRAGMRALLVDPSGRHDVPRADRLVSVLDLRVRLLECPASPEA